MLAACTSGDCREQQGVDLREQLPSVGPEVLRLPRSDRLLERWNTRGLDVAAAAEFARVELVDDGVCLPVVWLADALVVPVVRIDPAVVAWRAHRGLGAFLDRTWWRDLGDRRFRGAPPSPVEALAFLTVGELSRCRTALGRLRPMARTIALVPEGCEPDTVELARCDYFSIPVAAVGHDEVRMLVAGDMTTITVSSRAEFHARLRREQLFDLALRSGAATAYALG
jgi:hypothetical protein